MVLILFRDFFSLSLTTVVTEQIFKIASMEPGAMLFEASREFEVSFPQIIIHIYC